MLELHYPTLTKTILKRQYPRKPTLKVPLGNGNGAIFENSSKLCASLFVTSRWPRSSRQTNYQVHPPAPLETFTLEKVPQLSADHHARWPPCKLWEHRFSAPDLVSSKVLCGGVRTNSFTQSLNITDTTLYCAHVNSSAYLKRAREHRHVTASDESSKNKIILATQSPTVPAFILGWEVWPETW